MFLKISDTIINLDRVLRIQKAREQIVFYFDRANRVNFRASGGRLHDEIITKKEYEQLMHFIQSELPDKEIKVVS